MKGRKRGEGAHDEDALVESDCGEESAMKGCRRIVVTSRGARRRY